MSSGLESRCKNGGYSSDMWWLDVNPAPGEPNAGGGQSAAQLDTGDRAPEFVLAAHDGSEVTSADLYGGKAVVLFYYPKANTSG